MTPLDYAAESCCSSLREILERSGEAMQEAAYQMTKQNIYDCWAHLVLFTVIFAVLSIIVLEFIDNDRR